MIVDLFAGGGGASEGIFRALGRHPDVAVNHDPEAVAMHTANHPDTRHLCGDVWHADPRVVCGGRSVDLAWFSPDCTHFSKAKGSKPRSAKRRALAWVVIRWARTVKPRVICLENVEEFEDWGPLDSDGMPNKAKTGLTFRRWVGTLKAAGYAVEWRELRACDYGAPTTRKRLFLVARCDDQPIVWPRPSHGPGAARPWRTAAECIDWSLRCPSIFDRKRPLAEKTLARIARGIRRFVLETATPFVVKYYGTGGATSVDEPLDTVTTKDRFGLVTPFITPTAHAGDLRVHSIEEPLRTITASRRGDHALVAPALIQTGYGEREGQAPRSLDLHEPLGTVVAGGAKHALVSAFLAKHFGGNGTPGSDMRSPVSTITTQDHNALVEVELGQDRRAEVRAFLTRFNGESERGGNNRTTARRFGLVTIEGQHYEIADIGMRMLQPRELFRAQGFGDEYVIDPVVDGSPLSKTSQIRMCGNSVAPDVVAAIVRANVVPAKVEAA